MKYRDYKAINENFFSLGLKTPHSLGAVGSKLSEMGLEAPPMDDPAAEEVPQEDDGMGGMDLTAIADVPADDAAPAPMGDDPAAGGDIDLSALGIDPQLLALLSMAGLNPEMLGQLGAGGEMGGEEGGEETAGLPVPAGDKGANPFEKGSPFGDKAEDGDEESEDVEDDLDDEADDAEAEEESSAKPPFAKEEDDSEESDDDDDSDDDDSDDEEEASPPPKFMSSGAKDKCCNKFMKKEDVDFLNALTEMGRGDVRRKHSSGLPKLSEEALLTPKSKKSAEETNEPKPGEVGYAPNGRVGSNFQIKSFSEWRAAKRANLND